MPFVSSPVLMLLFKLLAIRLPISVRYLLALALVGSCTALRMQLPPFMLPYLFFIPFLMINGFWFGVGPAILSTIVATASAEYFFVGTPFSFEFTQRQVVNNLSFALVSGTMAVVCALFRRSLELLFQTGDELERQVLHRTEERDSIWSISPDMLGVLNSHGGLIAVNPAWQETLGWSEAELLAGHFRTVIDPHRLERLLDDVVSGNDINQVEIEAQNRAGQKCWLSWRIVVSNGLYYACVRDVSEVKRHQLALDAAEQQLRQSQKMEAIGQLTGGIAHDFNNLLTAIGGSHELMMLRVKQGRVHDLERYVGVAQSAVQRASSLTHRLLAYARRQTLASSATDINRLVRDMEELIARTLGPHIQLEVVTGIALWNCFCDPHQLDNALLNLAINARDAMPDGGRLTIETANTWLDERSAFERDMPAGQYVSISVTDTGVGMSAETIQRIFDPFFTTKPVGSGTGLGLSMVYGFVRQSGGQVKAYSEVGQGSTMTLYLPRYHAASGELERKTIIVQRDFPAGLTVLVVEDEPAIRMLLAEALDEMGITVLEASDAIAALKILDSNTPIDLLITDVGLPGEINGAKLADAARKQRAELKVLFITGYAENSVLNNGMLDAQMAILTKPFAIDTLVLRLNTMLRPITPSA